MSSSEGSYNIFDISSSSESENNFTGFTGNLDTLPRHTMTEETQNSLIIPDNDNGTTRANGNVGVTPQAWIRYEGFARMFLKKVVIDLYTIYMHGIDWAIAFYIANPYI